ncbi:hypothetical protein B6S12_03205 [Helicobacter valdiviensis]|uniref:Formyl transferase N-terminal domain-containing protein n=1 Tax=Helicobacter valdiviensis TaxID=1458358 RepID=A0A2W6NMI6_9HELI|nr:formyltransferase family protein [Helicobacter valdiviensis]PZT48656.1 hypothetical protein B6S12_03205 [Helicobacter valdiviensis]
MKRVVFLGAKEIGLGALEELYRRQEELEYEIVGVFTSKRGEKIKEFCMKYNLPLKEDLEQILVLKCDLLFSVQYHQILQMRHLESVSTMAFNLHLAPLPEYRGCNQFSFAILNEDEEFGVSIHKVDCGIDSGDVVFQKRFKIPKKCFVEELVEIASKEGLKLFKDKLKNMIEGKYVLTPQSSLISNKKEFHLRNEINFLKEIKLCAIGGGGGGNF